ncbi:MAG: capsular biosynthesis protein [Clostridium sp.]|nr:capsular biosynthesis protein [Clostridium sp.]
MIDIHSHILPGIDDGSKSISMTLEMLTNATEQGTSKIIATPHFCRGYGEAEYDEVKKLTEKISRLAKDEKIEIEIYCGQEVYYSQSIISDYKQGIIGTLANSRYLLFELPLHSEFEKEVLEDIYELQILGVKPILAHPERYKFLKEEPYLINELIDEGILFQMNAGSIEGAFGRQAKKVAELFLDKAIYNFIGSDVHNVTDRTIGIKEGYNLAVERNKIYVKQFEESANKLLKNEEIEFYGEKIKRKKKFGFFW